MSNAKPLSLMDFIAAARSQIRELAPAELQAMRSTKADLLLVDVRESSEHEQGHIEGALLVPRGILEAAADLQYPKHHDVLSAARGRPVAVYCASGGRSALAALTLQQMGYGEVYNLAGGIERWIKEDFPLVREARYV